MENSAGKNMQQFLVKSTVTSTRMLTITVKMFSLQVRVHQFLQTRALSVVISMILSSIFRALSSELFRMQSEVDHREERERDEMT